MSVAAGMTVVAALALALALPAAATAQPVRLIADLSDSRIDIATTFAGAELLVFGAVQYPRGRLPATPPDLAVILRGPAGPVTVRRKSRVAGVWVNAAAERFETAPGFYALATSRPVASMLDERGAAIYEIGLAHLQLSPSGGGDAAASQAFIAGLVDVRRRRGLYSEQPRGVRLTEGVLYRARLPIPSQVPVGDYRVEIHLIADNRVLASATRPIPIARSGFERWVYVVAHQRPVAYGLAAVALALASGLAAGAAMRRD